MMRSLGHWPAYLPLLPALALSSHRSHGFMPTLVSLPHPTPKELPRDNELQEGLIPHTDNRSTSQQIQLHDGHFRGTFKMLDSAPKTVSMAAIDIS